MENKFLVGVGPGDKISILKPLVLSMTREDALNLAAWLVALADEEGRFPAILEEVQNS